MGRRPSGLPDGGLEEFLSIAAGLPERHLPWFEWTVMSRITNDGSSHAPIWGPDGKRIAYRTTKYGWMDLAWMPSDRSGPDGTLLRQTSWQSAVSFSPDGKYLAFGQSVPNTQYGTRVLPLTGERKPVPFAKSKFQQGAAKFSPDGRWVVYLFHGVGQGRGLRVSLAWSWSEDPESTRCGGATARKISTAMARK